MPRIRTFAVLLGLLAVISQLSTVTAFGTPVSTTTYKAPFVTWQKGYTADANHKRSSIAIEVTRSVKAVCSYYVESDIPIHCIRGERRADGTRALLPPGLYLPKGEVQRCGTTLELTGAVITSDNRFVARDYRLRPFRYLRDCSRPNKFVASFNGRGAGVKNTNVACDAGQDKYRIFRVQPGPNGNITSVGPMVITFKDGSTVRYSRFLGDVARPFGERFWEYNAFSNKRLDTSVPIRVAVYGSRDLRPFITLALTVCVPRAEI